MEPVHVDMSRKGRDEQVKVKVEQARAKVAGRRSDAERLLGVAERATRRMNAPLGDSAADLKALVKGAVEQAVEPLRERLKEAEDRIARLLADKDADEIRLRELVAREAQREVKRETAPLAKRIDASEKAARKAGEAGAERTSERAEQLVIRAKEMADKAARFANDAELQRAAADCARERMSTEVSSAISDMTFKVNSIQAQNRSAQEREAAVDAALGRLQAKVDALKAEYQWVSTKGRTLDLASMTASTSLSEKVEAVSALLRGPFEQRLHAIEQARAEATTSPPKENRLAPAAITDPTQGQAEAGSASRAAGKKRREALPPPAEESPLKPREEARGAKRPRKAPASEADHSRAASSAPNKPSPNPARAGPARSQSTKSAAAASSTSLSMSATSVSPPSALAATGSASASKPKALDIRCFPAKFVFSIEFELRGKLISWGSVRPERLRWQTKASNLFGALFAAERGQIESRSVCRSHLEQTRHAPRAEAEAFVKRSELVPNEIVLAPDSTISVKLIAHAQGANVKVHAFSVVAQRALINSVSADARSNAALRGWFFHESVRTAKSTVTLFFKAREPGSQHLRLRGAFFSLEKTQPR